MKALLYANWMRSPKSVPSSRFSTEYNRLQRQPLLINPTRPAIGMLQKKNSWGVKFRKFVFSTKPGDYSSWNGATCDGPMAEMEGVCDGLLLICCLRRDHQVPLALGFAYRYICRGNVSLSDNSTESRSIPVRGFPKSFLPLEVTSRTSISRHRPLYSWFFGLGSNKQQSWISESVQYSRSGDWTRLVLLGQWDFRWSYSKFNHSPKRQFDVTCYWR